MKIAIPTVGSIIDEYLMSCEVFTVFTIDESKNIVDSEILCTPQGCDCTSNIPYLLQEKGVSVMLAGNFTEMATGICKQHGITVYPGYSGNIREIVYAYLQISI